MGPRKKPSRLIKGKGPVESGLEADQKSRDLDKAVSLLKLKQFAGRNIDPSVRRLHTDLHKLSRGGHPPVVKERAEQALALLERKVIDAGYRRWW